MHEPTYHRAQLGRTWKRRLLVFAALAALIFAGCFALGLDTLQIGSSRSLRLIQPSLAGLLAVGAALLFRNQPPPLLPEDLRRTVPFWCYGVAAFAFLASAAIAVYALEAVPLSGDEGAYVYQADLFARGRVSIEATPIQPYVAQSYVFEHRGHLVVQYPPGWSALLAFAERIGIVRVLVNPLLGALAALAFWRLAASEYGREVALVACVLLTANGFFLFNSASFYNGPVTLLLGILFVTAACSFLRAPTLLSAIALGCCFSALAVVRHFDALLFALPVAVLFLRRAGAQHWRLVPVAALAALPLLTALIAYYWAATGEPLVAPQTLRNPNDGLFGDNWHALRVTEIMVGRLFETAEWTSPALALAFAVALPLLLVRGDLRFHHLYYPIFLAGYWMYWADGGHRWGPRYIYPALPFLILPVAVVVWRAVEERRLWWLAHLAVLATLLGPLQVPFLAARAKEIIAETQDVPTQVARAGLRNAVVVVASGPGRLWWTDVADAARNGLKPDGDVVYAHGAGFFSSRITPEDLEATVAALHRYFPEREIWFYRRRPDAVEGYLSRVSPPSS